MIKGPFVNTKSKGDRCFQFGNGSIGMVIHLCVDSNGRLKLLTKYFELQRNLFSSPCESKVVGIHSLKVP